MGFFSPFTDADGQPKMIFELVAEDLFQLQGKSIGLGWQIQYETGITTNLPEIISSFANELGGWCIIGFDGDSKEILPVEHQDYETILSNLLKASVSPLPKVEVRFFKTDSETGRGVVVIWVPEGSRPPYLCNGSIYRRSANGPVPVQNSDQLDNLYNKSRERQSKLKEFCQNDLTVNNSYWNSQIFRYIDRGMCSVYLLPIYQLNLLDKMSSDEWVEQVIAGSKKAINLKGENEELAISMPWSKGYYSVNSLIFRNSSFLDHYKQTAAWELFYDGSARFHIPIPYLELELSFWQSVHGVQKREILNDFNYIDGREMFEKILGSVGYYTQIMKKYFPELTEMQIVIGLENVDRDVLYFKAASYQNFLRDKGLVFSEKSHYSINHNHASLPVTGELSEMMNQISPIFNAFGLSGQSGVTYFYEAIRESAEFATYTITPR